MANPHQVDLEELFQQRLKATQALMRAYQRVRGDGGAPPNQLADDTLQQITAMVDQGEVMHREGRLNEAMTELHLAYLAIRLALVELRGGQEVQPQPAVSAPPAAAIPRERWGARVEETRALLEAYRRLGDDRSPVVSGKASGIATMVDQAETMFGQQQFELAWNALDHAFAAARQAVMELRHAPSPVFKPTVADDTARLKELVNQRVTTITSLQDAYQRISRSFPGVVGDQGLMKRISQLVGRSREHLILNNAKTAAATVEVAYLGVKMAVIELTRAAHPQGVAAPVAYSAPAPAVPVTLSNQLTTLDSLLAAYERLRQGATPDPVVTQVAEQLRNARQLVDKREFLGAKELLDQAYVMLKLALAQLQRERAAAQPTAAQQATTTEEVANPVVAFERQRASLESMLAAYQRISLVKGFASQASQTTATVEQQVRKAELLLANRQYQQAQAELEAAYLGVKQAIQRMQPSAPLADSGMSEMATSVQDKARYRNAHDQLATTVSALRTALLRIGKEKQMEGTALGVVERADRIAAEAATAVKEDQPQEGLARLEQAYALIKTTIGELRGGDVLVRELKFASAEEEYYYEVDRNDTYRMLMEMMGAQPTSQAERSRVPFEQALALREQAKQAATGGDFTAGIKLLEESTEAYKKILRQAGLALP